MSTTPPRLCLMDDLTDLGLPEVPLLGHYRFRAAEEPLIPHTHPAIEICLLVKGRQQYRLAGRDYDLTGGDLFVTLPDELHDTGGRPQEPGELFWLHVVPPPPGRGFLGLRPAVTAELVAGFRQLASRQFRSTPAVRAMMAALWALHTAPTTPFWRLRLRASLVGLLAEILGCQSRATGNNARSAAMERVVRHIAENVAADLSLPRLASVAGLSEPWFKARFRRELGVSPATYVNRVKIDRACELLARPGATVTRVAFLLGFRTSQYFATVFRRHQHQSPAAWQAAQGKTNSPSHAGGAGKRAAASSAKV